MSSTTTLDVGLPVGEGLVVVTGAAGGIGRAIAEAFGRQGRPLILCDLNSTSDVEASIKASLPVPNSVVGISGDISDPSFPDKLITALEGRRIAVFAHSAGMPPSFGRGPKVFDINFTASKRLVETLQPHMESNMAAMILMASLSGAFISNFFVDFAAKRHVNGHWSPTVWLLSRWSYTSYAISKRCVQLYVVNKSLELSSEGLRIVSVSPCVIETAMMTDFKEEAGLQAFIASAGTGRMGKPDEEVTSAVELLGPPGASYVTGADVLVDGGLTAKRTAVRRSLFALIKSPPRKKKAV